jgi:hypothetical protein
MFLRKIEEGGPIIANVLESESLCVIREDLADAIVSAQLDVCLLPAYYDGEVLPDPGPTFPGRDWSDLKE